MPSFDIVSEIDMQEVDNAVQSASREILTRFDFKGSTSSFERVDKEIIILADNDTKNKAMIDMLKTHFTRRKLDSKSLEFLTPEVASGNKVRQKITVKEGIEQDTSKKITKELKASKAKVQASIRGEELRITGKKRDDLQEAIQLVKDLNLPLPLQFTNFRD
jgi:uncharacterized protein YajQ (UPF0234 family)